VSDKIVDCEVVAAWDSGETRPAGFSTQFCRSLSIPHTPENLENMLQLVDGVIIHTTNWQRHLEQARLFVEAGKSVFIDKPIVGNMRDATQLLAWLKQGYRITGGSALRFTAEVKELLQTLTTPEEKIHTVYSFAGMDDFNYGIHTYSLVSQIMGSGLVSAQYLCTSG
jgi:predicted dehydrogenase